MKIIGLTISNLNNSFNMYVSKCFRQILNKLMCKIIFINGDLGKVASDRVFIFFNCFLSE